MKAKKLLKHTKKYVNDFVNEFCKGNLCGGKCGMNKKDCILNDLVNAEGKAIDLAIKRKK